jgi:hypothetical protein
VKKAKIIKRLEGAMTVGKLKGLLSKLPDDMPVGRVGHFGEFVDMSERGASVKTTYLTDSGWRGEDRIDLTVLDLETPDIGSEPD